MSQSTPIRVVLVDDHDLVREGLRLVLERDPDVEVVGEAATPPEAFEVVEAARPDVLLLDLAMPGADGIVLLAAMHDGHPGVRILVVTMDRAPETVRQALIAGASGYIVKGARADQLREAVRAVARDERYLHSSVTAAIVDDSIHWLRTGGQMTVREREILGHLAAGRSPSAIAAILGISIHTVRRHIVNLSDRLGIHGRVELTRYAMTHGFTRDT